MRERRVLRQIGLRTTHSGDHALIILQWHDPASLESPVSLIRGGLGISESNHRSLLSRQSNPTRLHSARGREGGARGRYRMANLQAHLPFLAGCNRRTDRRAAKIDAARTGVNHDEHLWERLDEVQAQGEQQSGTHGTSSHFAANKIETGPLAQPRFTHFMTSSTLIGPFWTGVGNV